MPVFRRTTTFMPTTRLTRYVWCMCIRLVLPAMLNYSHGCVFAPLFAG